MPCGKWGKANKLLAPGALKASFSMYEDNFAATEMLRKITESFLDKITDKRETLA